MRRAAAIFWATAVLLACAGAAQAQPTVTITGTNPSNGVIDRDGTAVISWIITSGTSGTYDVEVGGSGTEGTGKRVVATNGSGTFNGTRSGQTTISAEADLGNVQGTYTIYVIAVAGQQTANASTSLQLEIPPDQVEGVSAGRGDSTIYLGWTASLDTQLSYYNIYYAQHHGTLASDYDGTDCTEGVSPINAGNPVSSSTGIVSFEMDGLANGVTYYIRVSAVDASAEEGPLSAEVYAIPTVSVGYSELSNDPGGCFIATAAFGNYNHPLVKNLRAFRDGVLARSPLGRAFVRGYYAASPPLARLLARHPAARAAVRFGLTPISWLAGAETGRPGAVSLPALLALVSALAWLTRRRREVSR
jgi:hypothetical protein